jgi:hypothetical protein
LHIQVGIHRLKNLVGMSGGHRFLRRPSRRWKNNIGMYLMEMGGEFTWLRIGATGIQFHKRCKIS